MPVRFSLDRFLDEHDVTAYRLAKETEGQVARGSVYAMAHGDRVQRVDLENLGHIIQALGAILGRDVEVAELFDVDLPRRELRMSKSGAPFTDDPETNSVLDDHPDILDRLREAREPTTLLGAVLDGERGDP